MYLIEMNYPNQNLIERVLEHLNTKADKDGVVNLTGVEIAAQIGESRRSGQVASALSIMARYGAVERSKEEVPLSRVKILMFSEDPVLQSYMDLIRSIGVQASDGYYEFGMPAFVERSKLKESKAKDALKLMDRNALILFARPFRGKTTRILKGPEVIDFKGLHARKMEDIKRLDALKEYVDVADADKHQFLLSYFGII
jgi:hypothetical protein